MVKVKICGITNLEDALLAIDLGADALGFNFYKKSPRYLDPTQAKSIIEKLPPLVSVVGIFVDEFSPDRVTKIARGIGLNTIQLHGQESADYTRKIRELRVIKAFRVSEDFSLSQLSEYPIGTFLLDAYVPGQPGGTGQSFNWEVALAAKKMGRIILAGGLTPANIRQAALTVQPYALDVCSGVEEYPGKKNLQKMIALFHEISQARSEVPAKNTGRGSAS